MKILKYGDGYPKTCTCDKCKSELEYDADDIRVYIKQDVSFLDDKRTIIKNKISELVCPVCEHTISLGSATIYEHTDKDPSFMFAPTSPEPTKKEKWWQR